MQRKGAGNERAFHLLTKTSKEKQECFDLYSYELTYCLQKEDATDEFFSLDLTETCSKVLETKQENWLLTPEARSVLRQSS